MLIEAACVIPLPSVNSNSSYHPETLKLEPNSEIFGLCDLEIRQITLKYNRPPLHHCKAICEFNLELQSGNAQIGAKLVCFLAATKQLYKRSFSSTRLFVCPSVRPSVIPFSLCSHRGIIMKFWEVITNDRSGVHAREFKVRGQRSRSQRSKSNIAVSGL